MQRMFHTGADPWKEAEFSLHPKINPETSTFRSPIYFGKWPKGTGMGDRRWWWNSEGGKSVKCVSSAWPPPCNGVQGHCLASKQTPLHRYPSYCLRPFSSALTVHMPVCSPSESAWFPTKIQRRKRINMNCHHCVLVAQLCRTLCNPRLLCPWNFPGKIPGVGHIPSSRGSSWPRERSWVSCIAGRCFYHLSHQRRPEPIWIEYMMWTEHMTKCPRWFVCLTE